MVVKQNPYDSANGHHVEHCGNAHLKNQVDQRLDSDDIKNASTELRRSTAATTDHFAKVRRLLIVGQSLAY